MFLAATSGGAGIFAFGQFCPNASLFAGATFVNNSAAALTPQGYAQSNWAGEMAELRLIEPKDRHFLNDVALTIRLATFDCFAQSMFAYSYSVL